MKRFIVKILFKLRLRRVALRLFPGVATQYMYERAFKRLGEAAARISKNYVETANKMNTCRREE